MKSTVYTIKQYRGIDDLQSIYAFRGNSQGDETRTNDIEEYARSEGWLSFEFNGIDSTDQEAINREALRRAMENLEYTTKLHEEGRYGEEYSMYIDFVYNPELDEPSNVNTSSSKFMIFDASN